MGFLFFRKEKSIDYSSGMCCFDENKSKFNKSGSLIHKYCLTDARAVCGESRMYGS